MGSSGVKCSPISTYEPDSESDDGTVSTEFRAATLLPALKF